MKWIIGIIFPISAFCSYDFKGEHYIADYYECDEEILCNSSYIRTAMIFSCLSAHTTIINQSEYHYLPEGYTLVLTLSESHASIHTYPEHRACFIDIFTCGDNADLEKFTYYMKLFLKPSEVNESYIQRGDFE